MKLREQLSFDGFVLDHVEMHECNYNWKTFIEVYLEDYHVGPFHPGLGNFVTCDDLKWEFAKEYSVQTVGVAPSFGNPGSDIYKKWHEVLLNYRDGKLPERGAIWLTYYPHIMVEWYPHVLTVSTLHPVAVDKTLNVVEFYYPRKSRPSSPSSCRRKRPPIWRPALRTTRSPSAWTRAARPV